MRLLEQSWQRDMFEQQDMAFEVYQTQNFETPMEMGVSLYLYRVAINTVQRTPRPRSGPQGRQRRPQLPLDLHFLLIPWAKQASLSQAILGWMMRTIEDSAILPSGLLNTVIDGVFDDDETVEVVFDPLSNEDMFCIWDILPHKYHISVSYIARIIRIDSELDLNEAGLVRTKELDFGAWKV